MNEIQIFNSEEFGHIRTIVIDGETWFCGRDVCNALGYTNSRKALKDHCNPRWVTKRYIPHPQASDKQIEMIFISEPNLYRLIAHSKLEEAIRFENWIFEEVLPAIRKTGGYGQQKDIDCSIAEYKKLELLEKKIDTLEKKLSNISEDTVQTIVPCFYLLDKKIDSFEKKINELEKKSGRIIRYVINNSRLLDILIKMLK